MQNDKIAKRSQTTNPTLAEKEVESKMATTSEERVSR